MEVDTAGSPYTDEFICCCAKILSALWVEALEGEADLAAAGRAEEDVVGVAEAFAADLECAAEAVNGVAVWLGPAVWLHGIPMSELLKPSMVLKINGCSYI